MPECELLKNQRVLSCRNRTKWPQTRPLDMVSVIPTLYLGGRRSLKKSAGRSLCRVVWTCVLGRGDREILQAFRCLTAKHDACDRRGTCEASEPLATRCKLQRLQNNLNATRRDGQRRDGPEPAAPARPHLRRAPAPQRPEKSCRPRAAPSGAREAKEAQASRRTANSASPGYDPTAYAARRAAAIADAKRAEAVRRRTLRRRRRAARARAVGPRGYFPTTPVTPTFPTTSPVQQASPSPPPWERASTRPSGLLAPRRRPR